MAAPAGQSHIPVRAKNMKFIETRLAGAYVIEPEPKADHRGFFGRIWCEDELSAMGLETNIVQTNVGFSHRKGTLRGLHYQVAPHAEVKIVRCTRGSVYDVIVDLRPGSPTFRQWYGVELSATNHRMMYVPEGFATGYLTLEDDSEIYYHTSQRFRPESAFGVRYDDVEFGIVWPGEVEVISDQDRGWSDFAARGDALALSEG
jgi:dTDP-4-dehydrorhamnose 3,5-epimerase